MQSYQEKQEYKLMILYHWWWKYKKLITLTFITILTILSFMGYKYFQLKECNRVNSLLMQKFIETNDITYLEKILSSDSIYGLSPYHKLSRIILIAKNINIYSPDNHKEAAIELEIYSPDSHKEAAIELENSIFSFIPALLTNNIEKANQNTYNLAIELNHAVFFNKQKSYPLKKIDQHTPKRIILSQIAHKNNIVF